MGKVLVFAPGMGADGGQAGDSHQHFLVMPPVHTVHQAHDYPGK